MSIDVATELCRSAVMVTLVLCLPVLVAAMVVGLLISLAQAVTQLQEQTLSFVPKLVAMIAVLLLTMPWTLQLMDEYARTLFQNIPETLGSSESS